MSDPRDQLYRRVAVDLVGPTAEDEALEDKPTDVYLSGFLSPPDTEMGGQEDDTLGSGDDGEEETDDGGNGPPLASGMRPSSAGLSFAVSAGEAEPTIDISVTCGTYQPVEEYAKPDSQPRQLWKRTPHKVELIGFKLRQGVQSAPLKGLGVVSAKVYCRTERTTHGFLVTVAVINDSGVPSENRRIEQICRTLFQFCMQIRGNGSTKVIPRPVRSAAVDFDSRAAALIYRDVKEYATGHTCAAGWESAAEGGIKIYSDWLPRIEVPPVNPGGHEVFGPFLEAGAEGVLSANWYSKASNNDLLAGLDRFVSSYDRWIAELEPKVATLDPVLQAQARDHIKICKEVSARMRGGVEFLSRNADARRAFRAANQAMATQHGWSKPTAAPLLWRPFQLGFMLLTVRSIADPTDPHRETMDLLWFPTGGGKTEAYLALTAFLVFHLRLTRSTDTRHGISILTRYTLRLLTIQQFQRASALILACEVMRRTSPAIEGEPLSLGDEPIGIGLWVGGGTTPNKFDVAQAVLAGTSSREEFGTPEQIQECPSCRERLQWRANHRTKHIDVICTTKGCVLSFGPLPVWTVDEDIYSQRPSLLIGTADKFAQITRNPATESLFGCDGASDTPKLIIQDELHLISGPLGTLAAIYEVAVDMLCSRNGARPKLLGSTATIRRAEEQIRALFDRDTCQFPSPGLDASDSCFAVEDGKRRGRVYVGLSTAGRSAKFTLQAASASLLQAAGSNALPADVGDHYWTLVTYFNSLRELGGAVVLMQDDVPDSIALYATRWKEAPRPLNFIEELTSRRSSNEIPDLLKDLRRSRSSHRAIDILLATNMISVGIDIPRLGLMVVNGQPKGIAEYIQATSRVGRGEVLGVVLTSYNFGKARDRSHFESFRTWHGALYRDVEATSVTPFAARARDRALHAALVAAIRYLVPGMRDNPGAVDSHLAQVQAIIKTIEDRVARVDSLELDPTIAQLRDLLQVWRARRPRDYWSDGQAASSLMESAEKAAARQAAGRGQGMAWPTPNTLRAVEPGVDFRLATRLR